MDYKDPIPRYWTKASVDAIGARVAEALELAPGDDLHPLVEKLGGSLIYGSQSADEYEGGSIVVRSDGDFTIILSEITSPKRDRFTIAHELGHLFLHYEMVTEKHGNVAMRATRDKRPGDDAHIRAEWEANWFAAGFLMPAEKFKELSNMMSNNELATYFNVSGSAVEIRKKTLGIN